MVTPQNVRNWFLEIHQIKLLLDQRMYLYFTLYLTRLCCCRDHIGLEEESNSISQTLYWRNDRTFAENVHKRKLNLNALPLTDKDILYIYVYIYYIYIYIYIYKDMYIYIIYTYIDIYQCTYIIYVKTQKVLEPSLEWRCEIL